MPQWPLENESIAFSNSRTAQQEGEGRGLYDNDGVEGRGLVVEEEG
jgi:hypothetical protein